MEQCLFLSLPPNVDPRGVTFAGKNITNHILPFSSISSTLVFVRDLLMIENRTAWFLMLFPANSDRKKGIIYRQKPSKTRIMFFFSDISKTTVFVKDLLMIENGTMHLYVFPSKCGPTRDNIYVKATL